MELISNLYFLFGLSVGWTLGTICTILGVLIHYLIRRKRK
jgi:hypothetical protein